MRRLLLLLYATALILPTAAAFAGGGDDDGSKTLRRSDDALGSYPGGPVAKAPLATGYYVADNDQPQIGSPWAATYSFLDTTGSESTSWRRIVSGPNQRPANYWTNPANGTFGLEYFRNPFNSDSTDNAIAGPISIPNGFFYYGRRYDSFYVSTNGLVGLASRRFQYDANGNRIDYNPFRDDPRPVHSGGAVADTFPDDYGYKFVALGGGTTATSGLLNGSNTAFPNTGLHSTLAPLWDDQELSQFDSTRLVPDDFGRVYWRIAPTGDRIIVYFADISMKGIKNIPILGIRARVANRQIRADFQVVLNQADSSIEYNYRYFKGIYTDPSQGIFSFPSNIMYRSNATIGIQSHDYEYTNYMFSADGVLPESGDVYVNGDRAKTPHQLLGIKFKQWRNIVRVKQVTFQVPSRTQSGKWEDLPKGQAADNFELLLGDPILGSIRPVGIVQNVSDSIGPVNITPQPVRFNVVFRIRDLVNISTQPVYQRSSTTKSLPPIRVSYAQIGNDRNSIDTIVFEPYATFSTLQKQVGRFKAEIIATDQGPTGQNYGQQWPFDDTVGIRMFGINRQELPFISTFDDYDNSQEDGIIPSVRRWVSIGTRVVDGDQLTYNPPPPRGQTPNGISSPVAEIDRRDIGGSYYNRDLPGVKGGDTLISFPINLSKVQKAPVLILSYERAGKILINNAAQYPRGWSDQQRYGPEHATYNTLKTAFAPGGTPDQLVVEFAEPSPNGIDNVTNVQKWRDNNFNDKNGTITYGSTANSPRWGVFGGGGGGTIIVNDQSGVHSVSETTGKVLVDEFDAGKDFEFYRAYIPIPARWYSALNASKTFRFRIRGEMKNDGNPTGPPSDDGDIFYVDNVMLLEPDKPEVEVTTVGYNWPYTQAPASQARQIPLWAKIANNGSTAATAFGLAMYIDNLDAPNPPGLYNYYRYQTILSLPAGGDRMYTFPEWNAQECGVDFKPQAGGPDTVQTHYRIYAQILPAGYDTYNANDKTYTDFTLTIGPTFAYDDGTNDVGGFAGINGKGLNLTPATNQDGNGAEPYGPNGGSTSGSFSMQFRILTRDTIRGFQAYFAAANSSPDYVQYSIYKQPASATVGQAPNSQGQIASTVTTARRGEGIPQRQSSKQFNYDQFVTYMLDTALVVDPGLYFVTVSQLGQTGLELGGDASRMGQVTTIVSAGPPPGIGNYSIAAHPEFRQPLFFYEQTAGSNTWFPMINIVGNPGFPHLNYRGDVPPLPVSTYTRGSWIPMIRPYFGVKESKACAVEPVELASFEVKPLATALRLDWSTASEMNNSGFQVERRVKGEDSWSAVEFVKGAGTSNQVHAYGYTDTKVVSNTTYQYRLKQVDFDGAVTYSGVREGRLMGAVAGMAGNSLDQNTPNPVNGQTTIGFNVVEDGQVQLQIVDMYGKVVRSISVDAKAGDKNTVVWDGNDNDGVQVANGAYVYKLVGNGFTLARKMTVTRH